MSRSHTTDARHRRRQHALAALAAAVGLLTLVAVSLQLLRAVDAPDLGHATSPVVLDRDGRLLRAFTVDDGRWRLPVRHEQVDPLYLAMLLGYEDQRFYAHHGIDPRALIRAAWQALRYGRIVSGGSTLTMQVVRLRLGLATRSVGDKWRQLLAAWALEREADKAAIIDAYLNLAPFGGNLEGVRAASLAWFGREPRRLTPAQAALLVALPQAPEQRRPDRFPEAARRGRHRVLARARVLGLIDAETERSAHREPMPARRRDFPRLAPHLTRRAVAAAPQRAVHRLTLDADLQGRLEALASEHAMRLPDAVSVAILVADHQRGEVLASVGSAGLLERERDGFVDMTRAPRSPGSTLKPLIYGLAFERGLAHPESLIEDRPRAFGTYVPENFDRGFQGTVTVRQALQQSLNVPAITLLERVGPARLLARLRRAGAVPRLPTSAASSGLAIGLGGLGLTLRDLVAVYAAIANGGRRARVYDGLAADAGPDARLARADSISAGNAVLSGRAAWYLGSILSGADRLDRLGGEVAAKTGTSYGYRDAWAIGYDGGHVVGVWVGRPDGAAVPGLTGTEAAVPILRDAFVRLGAPVPLPGPPTDVLFATSASLPPPLRAVDRDRKPSAGDAIEIAFPPPGARVELGLGSDAEATLALKVRNGQPPFTWLVNDALILRKPHARVARWRPDSPGFATIAVIDARGASDRVQIRID